MAQTSKIEWTEASWNPIVGCTIATPGCTNCYAMKSAYRMGFNPKTPQYKGTAKLVKNKPVWTGKVNFAENVLTVPLRRKKPTTYFVNSMGDLFHEDVPDEWIDRVFAVMALCPQHIFQVLTKRAERMREYLTAKRFDKINSYAGLYGHWLNMPNAGWPLPNVWLGVSVEDQKRANERIPFLLDTPATVRFISAEPSLGELNIERHLQPMVVNVNEELTDKIAEQGYSFEGGDGDHPGLNWVIVGGESGPNARPMHPDWARSLRDQCAEAGVPFFFKQWGEWAHWPDDEFCALEAERMPDNNVEYFQRSSGEPMVWMRRVGKSRAGRLLDGVEHNGMPEVG